jgi:hypothetical protein
MEHKMATWIAHLRIAEYFLPSIEEIDQKAFVAGNIGPDCGVPNSDWSKFDPPTEVSHWRSELIGNEIDHESFRSQYLNHKSDAYFFYLGYYAHLLADYYWSQFVWHPTKEKYAKEISADKRFIWTVKKDWYDLDFDYLIRNPNLKAYGIFRSIGEFENKYFDYYPDDAFNRQFKYINEFYGKGRDVSNKEYTYLKREDMDGYIAKTCDKINEIFKKKNLTPTST